MADVPVAEATLRIFRGDREEGQAVDYRVPLVPGMVVLDALHSVQAHQAPDLAIRWYGLVCRQKGQTATVCAATAGPSANNYGAVATGNGDGWLWESGTAPYPCVRTCCNAARLPSS